MREMELAMQMKEIGYRVVPDLCRITGKYEIIVEPWNWDLNERREGRMKRTGFFFTRAECHLISGKETPFSIKLREIQQQLIDHITKRKTA